MTSLLRSEWLKVFSTRMWIGMLVGAIAFTAINVIALVFASGQQGAPPLTDPATVRSVYASAGSASVLVLVLGILGMTTEFRHMTVTSTFLATPRRGRVMAAKMGVYALVGALFGLVCALFATGLGALLLQLKEHAAVEASTILAIDAGTVLCFAIYAVVGVAVGSLLRNQIAAILIAVVWVVLVEALIVAFLPAVGKWLPGGAASAVLQTVSFTGTTYLPVWGGALLLLAYGVAFGVVAAATTLRRDIT